MDIAGDVSPDEAVRLIGRAGAMNLITRDELINVAIERTDIDSIEEFRMALGLHLNQRAP